MTSNTHIKKITCTVLAIFIICLLRSQDCGCTYSEVLNNTVEPCNLTIGSTLVVNSATSFRNALNAVNSSAGNVTILLENGSYQVASPVSYPFITASNLVIRSASGQRDSVILYGEGMKDVSPNTEDGLHVAGDYVTIADLTIRDVGNHGIQVSGHHVYVHNVRIQNTYQQMLKGATSENSIDSAVVQCSLFEYTSETGPNYYIGGLDIHKGHRWIVRDNVFKNIISPAGSVAEHAIHFWNNSGNNLIERNLIINCDRGIGFGLGNSMNTAGVIQNNMIYNDGAGQFNDVGIGLESSPGTKVFHNTIYIEYQNAIEYRFAATSDVEIKNNLTNKPITSRDGAQAQVESNVTNAQPDWFEEVSAGDLHLASPVASVTDQGIQIPEVLDDIDKTMRPQGPGPDIGVHEIMTTALPEKFNLSGTKVWPNPSNGNFLIHTEDEKFMHEIEVKILNVFGQQILETLCVVPGKKIDISRLGSGVFFILVCQHDKTETIRHIVY